MRHAWLAAGFGIAVLMAVAAPARAAGGDDFVCPVFNSDAVGEHNPNAVPIGGGDSTILPGNADSLNVPDRATNGDGTGIVPFVLVQWQSGEQKLVWPKELGAVPSQLVFEIVHALAVGEGILRAGANVYLYT